MTEIEERLDRAHMVISRLVNGSNDNGIKTCATCGRECPNEGMIGSEYYCHPADSTGPTCYSKASMAHWSFDSYLASFDEGMP